MFDMLCFPPRTKKNIKGDLTSVPGCPSAAFKTSWFSSVDRMCSRVQSDGRPSSFFVNRVGTLSTKS